MGQVEGDLLLEVEGGVENELGCGVRTETLAEVVDIAVYRKGGAGEHDWGLAAEEVAAQDRGDVNGRDVHHDVVAFVAGHFEPVDVLGCVHGEESFHHVSHGLDASRERVQLHARFIFFVELVGHPSERELEVSPGILAMVRDVVRRGVGEWILVLLFDPHAQPGEEAVGGMTGFVEGVSDGCEVRTGQNAAVGAWVIEAIEEVEDAEGGELEAEVVGRGIFEAMGFVEDNAGVFGEKANFFFAFDGEIDAEHGVICDDDVSAEEAPASGAEEADFVTIVVAPAGAGASLAANGGPGSTVGDKGQISLGPNGGGARPLGDARSLGREVGRGEVLVVEADGVIEPVQTDVVGAAPWRLRHEWGDRESSPVGEYPAE